MQRDIRNTGLYAEAEALYRAIRQPGTGQIFDAAEINAAPDGKTAVFAGVLADDLESATHHRICRVDLTTGRSQVLTFGPNTDRLPKYSPNGLQIAFLSDRKKAGNFQLYLLDAITGTARATVSVPGWVEYLHWSPDGSRILLGVAGHGADVAGGQGAITSKQDTEGFLPWMPAVDIGDEDYRWRRAWIYQVAADRVHRVICQDANIWEATWCGENALAAITSSDPREGCWYTAHLQLVELDTDVARKFYEPRRQIGCLAASPSGKYVAVVEALCSDRGIVCGDLRLLETGSEDVKHLVTHGVDITHTEWISDLRLLLAGHRGFESVVGHYDVISGVFTEIWASKEISAAGRYITVSGVGASGDCLLVGESFARGPEVAAIAGGEYKPIRSFDVGYRGHAGAIKHVDRLTWNAPDGLEIQGWLLRPAGEGPYPTVMIVHGGPIWHWHPAWMGRGTLPALMLLKRGYAILFPNPRGSTGRGQEFAGHVLGDMGGADTEDCLSGLDYLVEERIADRSRLGVTGGSYGGFMTCWLITQDERFAAAVAVAPVTNQVSEHLLSNIPHFVRLFLGDHFNNPGGKYFSRSPVMHAHKVRTPTMSICGALDRCTPPEEATQFHNALLENRVKSLLVTYPEEGHGIRKLPAAIDYTARVVAWFEEHIHSRCENAE